MQFYSRENAILFYRHCNTITDLQGDFLYLIGDRHFISLHIRNSKCRMIYDIQFVQLSKFGIANWMSTALFSILISNFSMFNVPLFLQLGLATFDVQPYWSQKHFEHMSKVHLLTSRVTVGYFLSVKSSIQLKQQNVLLLQLVSLLLFRFYVW